MKQYFSFQWHITDECDQRCKHCYIFSEDNCKNLDSMTWEQMQDTFQNCLDFCRTYGRLPYFYITGGDPILHPDFWRFLELLKSHDIPFTILGNPFHLNDEVCQKLKGYGCEKYQLSLDGMRETLKIPQNAEEGMIYGGCNCGNCHLTILPTGDIYACRRVQNSRVGNVFTDRIADVWLGRMEQYREYKKFEKCAKCELLAWCRGCPAVASGKDGDFYAADPQCWKEVG